MICLDNTDTLEAGASVDAKVDYTVHGLVGTTFTMLADGLLSDTDPSVIYTAGAAISIVSVIFVNTHTSAVTCNLYLDSANGGNPRRMIPKDVSLGIGYSLHFDGQRISIMDPTGGIAYTYIAHAHDGDTLQLDGINSDGGAFPFTTSGDITLTQSLAMANGKGIDFSAHAHAAGMTSELLADYEEGTWTPVPADADSGGNTGSATAATGKYTKIGRTITTHFAFTNVDTTGLTGGNDFFIQGAPFIVGAGVHGRGIIAAGMITFSEYLTSLIAIGTAAIRCQESADGAGNDFVTVAEVADDAGDLFGFVIYDV